MTAHSMTLRSSALRRSLGAFLAIVLCGIQPASLAAPAQRVSSTPAQGVSSTPAQGVSATPAQRVSSTPAQRASSTPTQAFPPPAQRASSTAAKAFPPPAQRASSTPAKRVSAAPAHRVFPASAKRPTPKPATLTEALRQRMKRLSAQGVVVGASVVSLRDGRSLFDSRSEKPLTPASTMKVLTGAAILDRLGPDWTYETRFFADGPIDNGVVNNLYVVGSCAPDLVVERFPEIGAAIRQAGVREVRGDVVVDLSYFDGEERPPEWPWGRQSPYSAPISALAANFSSVRVTVSAGPRPGPPAVGGGVDCPAPAQLV